MARDELDDDDRLPWLETVEEDYQEGPSALRLIALVILGLGLIAGGFYGYYWYKQNYTGPEGNGALIAAPEGSYKVKPDEPGGMKVEGGQGDAAYATSQGAGPGNGTIDFKAVPEAPVTAKPAPVPATTGPSGALVQLGSFPSEGVANATWATLSKRFAYLAPLGKSVEAAAVGGKTMYRLRVNAGSANAANDLCAKLKVAGEPCFIAN